MSRATIKDVADYAGVSNATVSRVLNNNPQVDENLRRRVLKAIETLGYQPNRDARRLRARSSNVIGLVISDIQNPYFISVVRGVEDAAYQHQMNVILCNSDEDVAKQRIYLGVMEAERVAGLIIVPSDSRQDKDIQHLQKLGIPIILLDRSLANMPVDAVQVDNVRGAHEAVSHLLNLGYRRIGMISGANSVSTGRDRYLGYLHALADAKFEVESELVKYGNFKMDSGYRLTRELMTAANPPEAIFIANNLMTLGALQALRELQIRIPEDVALIGFDDMPWSGDLYSPLTAVSQPTYELGQEAVQLLLRRLAAPEAPFRTTTLQTRLIVRESCGVQISEKSQRQTG